MTTNHSRKSNKKEMLVFSPRRLILATVAAKYRVSLTSKRPSYSLGLKHCTTLKSILSRIRSKSFAVTDGLVVTNKGHFCIGAAPKLETLVFLKRR